MSDHSYMFIDGASLEKTADDFGIKWFGEPAEIDYRSLGQAHRRVFYYHALPSQRKNENPTDFDARLTKTKDFFRRLQALNGWHVHFGITKRHKGEKAEQKEVDVLLAVDMLTHVHRRNASSITLLTCDLDFRPLLDAVVREGIYTNLIYDPNHTNDELIATVDSATPLTFFNFWMNLTLSFKTKHGSLCESNAGGPLGNPPDGVCLAQAKQNDKPVAHLWSCEARQISMITASEPAKDGYYKQMHADAGHEDLLKRVFEDSFGEVTWASP